MSSEPSYPKDAAIGDAKPLNETLGVAVSAKQAEERAKDSKGTTRSFVKGAAVGVGSAAVVAALLYANASRTRRGDKPEATATEPHGGTLPAHRSDLTDHPDS